MTSRLVHQDDLAFAFSASASREIDPTRAGGIRLRQYVHALAPSARDAYPHLFLRLLRSRTEP